MAAGKLPQSYNQSIVNILDNNITVLTIIVVITLQH